MVFKSSSMDASVVAMIVDVVFATLSCSIPAGDSIGAAAPTPPPLPPTTVSTFFPNSLVKFVDDAEDVKCVVRCEVMLRMRFDGTLEVGMPEDAAGVDAVVEMPEAGMKAEVGGVVGGVVGVMEAMVVEVVEEEEEVLGVVDMTLVGCCRCC